MPIDRAFVRIAEGLVHYRHAGTANGGAPLPLYMLHASPASSVNLVPLIGPLAGTRRVIAPDTLGFGDSPPPAEDVPEIADYADSVDRVMAGLGLDCCDVYGTHTGAHIAIELAIRHPTRVRRLILDGVTLMSSEARADMLANYAPEMKPGAHGEHLIWACNYVRDQFIYFPHYRQNAKNLRQIDMSSPEAIHSIVMEVLKGLGSYHKGYRAVFRHDDAGRMPLIKQRTYCIASEDDPLRVSVERAASLIPGAAQAVTPSEWTPEGAAKKAKMLIDFLDAP
jgi:pimeloyl-ACP methyl ester carboxylesterase